MAGLQSLQRMQIYHNPSKDVILSGAKNLWNNRQIAADPNRSGMFRCAQHDSQCDVSLAGTANASRRQSGASLMTCGEDDVQAHGQEKIHNQNRKR
jgi:hypothetical protein